MNAKQIEVHNYYKSLHPKALILYRVPGRYKKMLLERQNHYQPFVF